METTEMTEETPEQSQELDRIEFYLALGSDPWFVIPSPYDWYRGHVIVGGAFQDVASIAISRRPFELGPTYTIADAQRWVFERIHLGRHSKPYEPHDAYGREWMHLHEEIDGDDVER